MRNNKFTLALTQARFACQTSPTSPVALPTSPLAPTSAFHSRVGKLLICILDPALLTYIFNLIIKVFVYANITNI